MSNKVESHVVAHCVASCMVSMYKDVAICAYFIAYVLAHVYWLHTGETLSCETEDGDLFNLKPVQQPSQKET